MIYRRKGLLTGSEMNPIATTLSQKAIEIIAQSPVDFLPRDIYDDEKQRESYKQKEAVYFISGEMKADGKGKYIRNGNNVLNRDLIVIDIEDTGKTTKEVLEIIQEKLQQYKYLIYQTMNHTEEKPRLRLVLEPNRLIENEEDYKATIACIMNDELNLPYDKTSKTWSQMQGAPVGRQGSPYIFIKKLEGGQYPVVTAPVVEVPPRPSVIFSDSISDDEFIEMFKLYLNVDSANLYTEDNKYNRCLSVLLALARAVCEEQISYDVAIECSELLATTDPNYKEDYIKGNLEKINHAIKSYKNNNSYFVGNPKSYTIFEKFRATSNSELNNKLSKKKPITTNKELFQILYIIGEQWREDNKVTNKQKEVVKIPLMPHYTIANILIKWLPIKLGGYDDNNALLYYFDLDKGIYTTNEDILKKCIEKLEYRQQLDKINSIVAGLKTKVEYERITRNPNKIAVGNGIFNLDTKELEPFSSKHFITAKVDTNYNVNAVENYNKIKDTYFDVDKWFSELACGDEEVEMLLQQLVNEAVNPNKTRRKIAIFLGGGRNGKSTFQTMLTNLIGANNISTLTPHEMQSRFGLSGLEGKICNLADEIGTSYLDEVDKLKSIASGEMVSYEKKNKDVRFYDFKTLLMFNSNGMPRMKEKSNAMLDRLLIIPFNASFEGKEDKSIKDDKLKNKVILEYILYKALHLDFEKFIIPKVVEKAVEDYKIDNDSVYDYMLYYIDNNYHEVEAVPVKVVTSDYESFCNDNGYPIRSRIGKELAENLNDHFKGKRKYLYVNQRYNSELENNLRVFGWFDTEFKGKNPKSIVKKE